MAAVSRRAAQRALAAPRRALSGAHLLTKKDLAEAHVRVRPFAHLTPVMTCKGIERRVAELYGLSADEAPRLLFKCENFQRVGAFKFRGACNAVFSIPDAMAQRGVATHSSGNHGAALALAASIRGIRAHVVMPSNSPKVKIEAVRGYGAEAVFCEPTLPARESTLADVVKRTGAVVIHPYNDFHVIAGQATATMELLEQAKHLLGGRELDFVLSPVGGGGLTSGTALAAEHFSRHTKVIGVEPQGADDAVRSMRAGRIVPQTAPNTIADGLRTSLGDKTFPILKALLDDLVAVQEATIVDGMRLVWERMKIIIEPSSSVPLAALLDKQLPVEKVRGKAIGVLLCGGNVDLDRLPWLAASAAVK
jgi:threonine dehydratase